MKSISPFMPWKIWQCNQKRFHYIYITGFLLIWGDKIHGQRHSVAISFKGLAKSKTTTKQRTPTFSLTKTEHCACGSRITNVHRMVTARWVGEKVHFSVKGELHFGYQISPESFQKVHIQWRKRKLQRKSQFNICFCQYEYVVLTFHLQFLSNGLHTSSVLMSARQLILYWQLIFILQV